MNPKINYMVLTLIIGIIIGRGVSLMDEETNLKLVCPDSTETEYTQLDILTEETVLKVYDMPKENTTPPETEPEPCDYGIVTEFNISLFMGDTTQARDQCYLNNKSGCYDYFFTANLHDTTQIQYITAERWGNDLQLFYNPTNPTQTVRYCNKINETSEKCIEKTEYTPIQRHANMTITAKGCR